MCVWCSASSDARNHIKFSEKCDNEFFYLKLCGVFKPKFPSLNLTEITDVNANSQHNKWM